MTEMGRLAVARGSFALVAFVVVLAAAWARSDDVRLAIRGYDPVAYFTDGKPTPGQAAHEYVWHDLRWRFASLAHREAFAKEPVRYAPQYDGYCALGVAWEQGHKDVVDPEAWVIVDGKLYLTYNHQGFEMWQEKQSENIERANQNWVRVKDDKAVYDGYPNIEKKN
jgi:hypothetical protein